MRALSALTVARRLLVPVLITPILVLCTPALSACEEPAEVAYRILQALRFPADEEVEFTQRQRNPLFKRISTQRGILLKSAQDGLLMRVIEPRHEERIIHDGMLTLRRESRRKGNRPIERHTQLDATRPSHLVLLALEAVLNQRLDRLDEHFQITAHLHAPSADNQWQIKLTPTTAPIRKQLSAIYFHGQRQFLTGFRSERLNPDGDVTHWIEVTIQPPR